MKLSRRDLVLGAATLPQIAASQAAADPLQEAREANRHNAEALSKVDVATNVEPAFQFRA